MFRKNDRAGGSQRPQKRNKHTQHGDPPDNTKNRKKREPPSEEVLQLSAQLKTLSREKKLDEALTVFWDSSNSKIRDGHHACIMVDMAARCGNIAVRSLFLIIHLTVSNFLNQFLP